MADVAKDTEESPLLARDPASERPPLYVFFIAGCAALNSVNLGYDMGVNSGVSVILERQWDLSDWEVGIYMGSLSFIAAMGALFTSGIADYLGRCKAFAVSQLLFITGLTISCLARGYSTVMVGRFFLGIGVGLGLAMDPMYIAELSPANYRGLLTSWSEFAINVGILLGFATNAMFAQLEDNVGWRVMLGLGLILPVVLMILSLFYMPESPRWLVLQGRDDEAADILTKTHPVGADIQPILRDLKVQVTTEQEGSFLHLAQAKGPTRRQLLIGIGVALAQQITGSDSVVQFSPRVFRRAGLRKRHEQFEMTALMGLVKTFWIGVAAFNLDEYGRRPLLILSNVAMAVFYVMIAGGLACEWDIMAVVAIMLFVSAFSIGMGPVCWLMASEIFPLKLRARAMSVATFSNRLMSGVVATTFLPIANIVTYSGYFLAMSAVTVCVSMMMWWFVPETKMMTLEQLSESFMEHEKEVPKAEERKEV